MTQLVSCPSGPATLDRKPAPRALKNFNFPPDRVQILKCCAKRAADAGAPNVTVTIQETTARRPGVALGRGAGAGTPTACTRRAPAAAAPVGSQESFATPNITQHALYIHHGAAPVGSQESFATPNITQRALYTMRHRPYTAEAVYRYSRM